MDKIKIENLEVFGNHGVFPEENVLGQKFLVSAVLYTNTREAGKTEDLTKSIHYGEVCHQISAFLKEHTFALIETAAEKLGEELLLTIPNLKKLKLEIKKPWAPIGLSLETVSVCIERAWHEAYIAFGSNLGDKQGYINDGIEELKKTKGCIVEQVSSMIETEPYGVTDQPVFLNGCLKLNTLLTPKELLERLHEIEQMAGRKRTIHWGPRTLDLDILFYDDWKVETKDLLIPHVELQKRLFVLEPMAELNANFRHPVLHQTIGELLKQLKEGDLC